MTTYYSIISAHIRPEIGEKISLGLLLVSGKNIFLSISKTKLSITKELLPDYMYHGVKNEIKGIQGTYNKFVKDNSLFQNEKPELLTESHINYLSNYKNNVVGFSTPQKMSIQVDKVVFNKLYTQFIDNELFEIEIDENSKSIEKFRRDFVPQLSHYYNVNFTVDNTILEDAIIPLKFDLVGKNEVGVFAKSIDLERRKYNVEHDVNAFYPIKDLSPESKKFIISAEPQKRYASQHQIWKNLRNSKWLEYVDVSEAEKLQEYAKTHDVEPLVIANSLPSAIYRIALRKILPERVLGNRAAITARLKLATGPTLSRTI